nr:alpha-(1,6)-fucosyltransferase-like [Procambarus clarkii]
MAAYGTNRTIVIDFSKWRYTNNGWKDIFLPFSASCNISKDNITTWPGGNDSQTIQFQGSLTNPKPEHIPLAIPRDISDRLIRLVGEPGAWWVGQFVKYVFKHPPYIQEIINRVEKSINFQRPIVGVHVRRTDKKSEASYHDLEEYMEQVEQYYNGLQIVNPNVTRRIYLASDEPSVFTEAKKKYPHYEILYHKRNIDVVKDETRFTVTSLRDLVVDIYFLARTDYIVVTLSSNVRRLVYELMQTMRLDAPNRCYSLDQPYWYHRQRDSYVRARFPHQSHRDNGVRIETGEKLRVSPPEASVFRKTLYEYRVSNNHATATMPLHKLQHLVDVVNVSYTYSD